MFCESEIMFMVLFSVLDHVAAFYIWCSTTSTDKQVCDGVLRLKWISALLCFIHGEFRRWPILQPTRNSSSFHFFPSSFSLFFLLLSVYFDEVSHTPPGYMLKCFVQVEILASICLTRSKHMYFHVYFHNCVCFHWFFLSIHTTSKIYFRFFKDSKV